ncbi:MAG: hypothetical protein Q9202_004369 [Teloschistes flavicans]
MAHQVLRSDPLRMDDPTTIRGQSSLTSTPRPVKKQSRLMDLMPKSSFSQPSARQHSPWNPDGKSPDDHARERQERGHTQCQMEWSSGGKWYSDAEALGSSPVGIIARSPSPLPPPPSSSTPSRPLPPTGLVRNKSWSPCPAPSYGSSSSLGETSKTSPFGSIGSKRSSLPAGANLRQRREDLLARQTDIQRIIDDLAKGPMKRLIDGQRYWADRIGDPTVDQAEKDLAQWAAGAFLAKVEQMKAQRRGR